MSLTEQEIIRREKLQKLTDMGINAFPADEYKVTHTTQSIKENFEEGKKVNLAGRLMSRRIQGKASFAELQDSDGRIQIYFNRDEICTGEDKTLYNEVYKHLLDIGDIIGVEGELFKTQVGEMTVMVKNFTLLTKALRPLPQPKTDENGVVHDAFNDPELRYRQRYVDLTVNPHVKEIFVKRTKLFNAMREFFNNAGYFEVETPILQAIPGGAAARPFITHHNALDMDLYMRIAPELYLKRLIVGGFEAVFEINRSFRNEGIDHTHNPEFTMIEFYRAYKNYEYLMDLTERLFANLIENLGLPNVITIGEREVDLSKFSRVDYVKSLTEIGGVPTEATKDRDSIKAYLKSKDVEFDEKLNYGELLAELFDNFVEKKLNNPTFVTGFPVEISPLAKRSENNPEITDRFELFIAGREIANGFNELNDPIDQAERFQAQVAEKDAGDDEAMHYDAEFVEALEYGLPPTAGEGIGIDRLVMLFADAPSIRDVILFPHMRRKD